ncbi:hypothetical protein EPUS_02406 [Endocarpon pusillum Z07020]|uniref:SnoaL-like domain-containing protein n=1 Tax=Endocarpon pusillum (strain Z07020 / HMAS-L-300199) TaxID=1263415 RepID=U1HPA0_ENDPU|nr:uncharacterized protein EPUS_02406 [Endocarpon pusillum Z07020]ERF70884.1 hypothetical protein EPUS_02406 [Endocarpon pusillum Z07020]
MKSLLSLAHSLPYAIPMFLVLLNPVSATSNTSCTIPPAPTVVPVVFPLSELPDYYYQPPVHLSSADQLSIEVSESQIRDKLSLYALALDGKAFDGLDYVFTDDVVIDFSNPVGLVRGLANVKEALEGALDGFRTHTLLGTQVINVDPNNTCTASTLHYFTTTFYGTGDQEGRSAVTTGQYRDRWYQNEAGEWFVVLRLTIFFVSNLSHVFAFVPLQLGWRARADRNSQGLRWEPDFLMRVVSGELMVGRGLLISNAISNLDGDGDDDDDDDGEQAGNLPLPDKYKVTAIYSYMAELQQ